jgi:hypothetical protein
MATASGLRPATEIRPGEYLHDVDIDWGPGSLIALAVLPPTSWVFGRTSKCISHCMYTLCEAMVSFKYEDIDGTSLIEFRGTKNDGSIGFQTMIPPSIWFKNGVSEPLTFVKSEAITHIPVSSELKQSTCLGAIGMIIARHLGVNGFGHEARLAWAGFLLRAGVDVEALIKLGEAMSVYCNNPRGT